MDSHPRATTGHPSWVWREATEGRAKVASLGCEVSHFGEKVLLGLSPEVVKASFTASDAAKEAFTAFPGVLSGRFCWSGGS
jgi:hypothetical protein